MLKLVSNKDGVEIHTLQIENGVVAIEPEFDGIQELLQGLTDKQQILNVLSGFTREYVWAVTHESPALPTLTRRQFRLALVTNGYKLADIETLIAQIEDDMQRQIIQIEWQDAAVFERNNSSLLTMAAIMGLPSAQIDELWAQALAF